MGTVAVSINSKTNRVKDKSETDHYWYDFKTQKMQKMRGGQLNYTYENGNLVVNVKPLDTFTNKNVDNQKEIMDWYNNNRYELDLDLIGNDGGDLLFKFPDDNADDVDASLYGKRFHYEIDYAQSKNRR